MSSPATSTSNRIARVIPIRAEYRTARQKRNRAAADLREGPRVSHPLKSICELAERVELSIRYLF